MTKTSSSSEWQCGTEPRRPGAIRSQCRPASRERSCVASGAVVRRPSHSSSSTSSTLRMLSGRGSGSPTASGSTVASTSHGSSSRPSTHGQPSRIARERGSQPSSVGWRVPKTSSSRPSGPATNVCSCSSARWIDAVARPHLVHALVLPGEPRPAQDEVELLRGAVRVRRRGQLAGLDPDAVHAHAARARRVAERLPARVHLALRAVRPRNVVPVRDRHRARSLSDTAPYDDEREGRRAGRSGAAGAGRRARAGRAGRDRAHPRGRPVRL